jgi:hypothetical protein
MVGVGAAFQDEPVNQSAVEPQSNPRSRCGTDSIGNTRAIGSNAAACRVRVVTRQV